MLFVQVRFVMMKLDRHSSEDLPSHMQLVLSGMFHFLYTIRFSRGIAYRII